MTAPMSYWDVAAGSGLGSERSYPYRREREGSGGRQTVPKKALLGDFSFVEESEVVTLLSWDGSENTVTI